MLGLTFSMITISKIECLGGLKDTAIYLDSHPQYKKCETTTLIKKRRRTKKRIVWVKL